MRTLLILDVIEELSEEQSEEIIQLFQNLIYSKETELTEEDLKRLESLGKSKANTESILAVYNSKLSTKFDTLGYSFKTVVTVLGGSLSVNPEKSYVTIYNNSSEEDLNQFLDKISEVKGTYKKEVVSES